MASTSPDPTRLPASSDVSLFSSTSPADGAPLTAVEPTSPSAVAEVVTRARKAQVVWSERPVRERIAALVKMKTRLLQRAQAIGELLHRECGKPIEEAVLAEVLPNADLVDYWTTSIEELLDSANVELDALAYPGKQGRIDRCPRGVVALVTPWNYPIAIPLRTIVPALLSGNAVVFKPSEVAPRAGALIAELFEGLLPDGLLGLVQGGGEVGAALIDADIDLVVFTGSVATGKRLAVQCAERLIPISLELGGKDAAIVLRDANVERTARGLVWGAFTNAGQNCASIERVYVEKPIADKLIERIVALTRELRPGVDTGVITTRKQHEIVRRHLDDAIARGAEVLVGGAPDANDDSLAFAPTVLRVTDEASTCLVEETFGPLMPVVVVDSEADAITRTNGSRFGLTTSLWTPRINHALQLARGLKSGVVTVNNHGFTAALAQAPWTGTGDSGYGITNSPHALSELTRPKFVLVDRSRGARELWWYPYTPALRAVAFAMAKLRGGAGLFGRLGGLIELITALPRRLLGK